MCCKIKRLESKLTMGIQMKKILSAIACLTTFATSAFAANEVNVYSYRQPYLIEPIFKKI